jgi:hypothetical protein
MAEPTLPPIPVSDRSTEPQAYQPVSGLAIGGLLVSGVYALIILVLGGAALYSSSPLLLPGWVSIGLPVVGAVLCFLARRQIQTSEGTRAGLTLANWGWWLSIVCGLGYFAFYAATYFAVRNQAEAFTATWLDLLRQGKLNKAFLLSQEPGVRKGVNPDDDEAMEARFNTSTSPDGSTPGLLTAFKGSEKLTPLVQGGPTAEFKPLGVRSWDFVNGHYQINRIYRITTSYGEFELMVPVQGAMSSKGEYQGREWHVVSRELAVTAPPRLTPKGALMTGLGFRAVQFLEQWGKKLSQGQLEDAYLDTCDPAQREQLRMVYHARYYLLNGVGGIVRPTDCWQGALLPWALHSLAPQFVLREYMPGFAEGTRNLLQINPRQFTGSDEAAKQAGLLGFQNLFNPWQSPYPLRTVQPPSRLVSGPPIATIKEDRVQCVQEMQLIFFPANAPLGPPFRCDARVHVESAKDYEQAGGQTHWRVVRVEPLRVLDMSKGPAGGARGGMPGRRGGP